MEKIIEIAEEIKMEGGVLYLVGGAVRDTFFGIDPKDSDFLVVGITEDLALEILSPYNPEKVIGNAPVYMVYIDGETYEFAMARIEVDTEPGKHGFEFITTPEITLEQDLMRRDFTVNALAQNVLTGEVFDPFNGIQDIEDGMLRHISSAFAQSPERVLRMFGFVSRFGFTASEELIEVCYGMVPDFDLIPTEQVWRHFEKMLTGDYIFKGLEAMRLSGWLVHFPSLDNLVGLEQEPAYHPEGDVWIHTCHTSEAMSKICNRLGIVGRERTRNMLAAICHDMGKFGTTEFTNPITSYGHDKNLEPAELFLDQIGCPLKMKSEVLSLVSEHMVHLPDPSKKAVRRLVNRLDGVTIQDLMLLVEADHSGRPPLQGGIPEGMLKIFEIAKSLGVNEVTEIEPILKGRHLIELGWKPSKHFGVVLRAAFQQQLDGVITNLDEALSWLRETVEVTYV